MLTVNRNEAADALNKDPASLYRAFEQVADGRKPKGKRYPLPLLLTLRMLGKLAGETSVNGILDWVLVDSSPTA